MSTLMKNDKTIAGLVEQSSNKYNTASTSVTFPYTATDSRELILISIVLSSQMYSGATIKINNVIRYGVGASASNLPLSFGQSFELHQGDVVDCLLNGYGETVTAVVHKGE